MLVRDGIGGLGIRFADFRPRSKGVQTDSRGLADGKRTQNAQGNVFCGCSSQIKNFLREWKPLSSGRSRNVYILKFSIPEFKRCEAG